MLPCGRPQRGGGTRVGAPPPGKLRILPRYMGGFFATCSPYVGTFFSFWGHYPPFGSLSVTFFPWGAFLLRFPPCGGHFIFIFQVGGGAFLSLWKPTPLRKLLRAPFRGVPRIREGGSKKYFFQIWKFACREATCCAWQSHALNS